jgi:hypothetical protein
MSEMRPLKNRRLEPRRSRSRQSNGRSRFRASDLKRAVKALKAVGINANRVEIDTDGKIVVTAATSTEVPADSLDRWMERHAGKA